MEAVLIRLDPIQWGRMECMKKTAVICESVPKNLHLPFRAYVYVDGFGVVGKFDCDEWRKTIDTPSIAPGSGYTKSQLIALAAEAPLCAWHVKEYSVVPYDTPNCLTWEPPCAIAPAVESWVYIGEDPT